MAKPTITYEEILTSLRLKREQIEEAILVIERLAQDEKASGGKPPAWLPQESTDATPVAATTPAPKKRTISPAGRKRIADAVRKRWAAKRAAEGTTKKAAKPKKAIKKKRG